MSGASGPAGIRGARIPSLDGLRALSILFVIIGHFQGSVHDRLPGWAQTLMIFLGGGDFGVSVFFVISGFLITWLLLQEEDRRGRIDLLAFYQRRAYRIWPAFYTLMAVLTILVLAGAIVVPWRDILAASTFVWNYVPSKGEGWWLGHTWSLAVEEQFYLLWPATLVLFGRGAARRVALAMIVLGPVLRLATYFLLPAARPYIAIMLHTRADALMFGCALALLIADARGLALVRRVVASRLHLGALAFMLLVSPLLRARFSGAYLLPAGWSLEGLGITLVLAATVLEPGTALGRFLNRPVLVAIGVRSYSLYLWQQIFAHEVPGVAGVPLALRLLFLVLAAEISYRFVELPVLALRQRRQAALRDLAAVEAQAAGAG